MLSDMDRPRTTASLRLVGSSLAAFVLLACTQAPHPDALVAAAREAVARRDDASALVQYKNALQQAPEHVEARLGLAELLLRTGDLEGASIELGRLHAAGAAPDRVVPLLAKVLVENGDFKRVVQQLASARLEEGAARARLGVELARAWAGLNEPARARAAAAEALRADAGHAPARILNVRILAGEGKMAEAAAALDAILRERPELHDGWHLRGDLYRFSGDSKAARAAYSKALELAPAYAPAHVALIASAARAGDVPEMKRLAAAMESVLPRHPATALVQVEMLLHEGDYAQARERVQLLLRAFPDQEAILYAAGTAEAGVGNVIQAMAHFGKVLGQNPDHVLARESMAAAEIRLGQYSRALDTLKPLLSDKEQTARALALAGEAHIKLGSPAAAEAAFQRAARMRPEDTRLQAAALASRLLGPDASSALSELKALAARSTEIYADQAIYAAYVRKREYGAARETLDRMMVKRPKDAALTEQSGRLHVLEGDVAAARRQFEEALRLDPALGSALGQLVELDLRANDRPAAERRLRAAMDVPSSRAMAALMLADLGAASGAPVAELTKLYADAVAAAPQFAEARLRQIEFLLRRRLFKDAAAQAQAALAALPGNTAVLDAAGVAQLRAGEVEQSLTTFRRLATTLPNSAAPHLRLAEAYRAMGKTDQVEAALIRALELEPGNAEALESMVDLLITGRRAGAAMTLVERLRSARPRDPVSYLIESSIHLRANDRLRALDVLALGLERAPASELAVRNHLVLLMLQREAEARQFGESWMKRFPSDTAMEFQLASYEASVGQWASAERRLRRVVAANPQNVKALNNLAYVLVRSGNKDGLEFAQRAVDLAPDRAALMDTLASALLLHGNKKAALDVQKRAVELAPDDPNIKLGLARVMAAAGDKAGARAELESLQKLGAGFPRHAEVGALLSTL